jgi:hypothetical protein
MSRFFLNVFEKYFHPCSAKRMAASLPNPFAAPVVFCWTWFPGERCQRTCDNDNLSGSSLGVREEFVVSDEAHGGNWLEMDPRPVTKSNSMRLGSLYHRFASPFLEFLQAAA